MKWTKGWRGFAVESYRRLRLFCATVASHTRDFLLQPLVIHKINRFTSRDVETSLDFMKHCFGVIPPLQLQSEILPFLQILKPLSPRCVLEIGTFKGGSLFLFSRVAAPDATIISIDLPAGKYGGGYPRWKNPLYRSFAKKPQEIHLLRMDSHSEETLGCVRSRLAGKHLDFLFIDGDHSYEGVKKDFLLYSPLLARRAIVAFHDIVPGKNEMTGGVPKFWTEIKRTHRHIELVENWTQMACGIGILFFDKN